MSANPYIELFAKHRSAAVPSLWDWQIEVLDTYAALEGDAAIELPTGAGKTLVGLLAGEHCRANGQRVAYLAGNKQLAQQVERQARALGFPVVRFEGKKETWDSSSVRSFNFGQAIGVMNYWNYFNASPGIEPAEMLILDDVHLLEGPLREMFTVSLPRSDRRCEEILQLIVDRYPYYSRAEDLLNEVDGQQPPEMLAFRDSAEISAEVHDLLDASLERGVDDAWWPWQRIREQLEVCCWLVSRHAVTLAPYIPPTQTLEHFNQPSRRLYLSATIGSADDLRRRLGAPSLQKLGAAVQPRQGERLVVMRDGTDVLDEENLIAEVRPILESQEKALWLCARKDTAAALHMSLSFAELDGTAWLLQGDNEADEPFAESEKGHLVTAGRYDGMDFPDETCRLEIVPEVPVATSDLEEFVSAYLRDAPFAEARFAQRVAQALGRCNRSENDRAAYLLTDPEFLGRFSQRQVLDSLPDHVRDDIYAAHVRADRGFEAGLQEAERFLKGEQYEPETPPARVDLGAQAETAGAEVDGVLHLWAGDYEAAASSFDEVARGLGGSREYKGFWLAMRSLAFERAASFGDRAAGRQAKQALETAASVGGRNTFFTRLRLAGGRSAKEGKDLSADGDDDLFAAWDRLMDRFGTRGPRFDRWAEKLLGDLGSANHDVVARAIASVGVDLLGLSTDAPQATNGEEDARWELPNPRRTLTFEVKLAPKAKRIVNKDIEQAEGASKAAGSNGSGEVRGLIVTPWDKIDESAAARLDRVRVICTATLTAQVKQLIAVLRDYRQHWSSDATARVEAREHATTALPPIDWLWDGILESDIWVEEPRLESAWQRRTGD